MRDKNLFTILSSLPFFEHLEDKALKALSSHSKILDFNRGEILYYEADVKDKIYYLLSGEIKFYKIDRFDNEIFLYYMPSNSMISDTTHVAYCAQRPCFANTEFTRKSQVIAFDDKYFFELINKDMKVAFFFFQNIYTRIEFLENVINRDVVYDGTAKVASMIVHDLVRFNKLKKHEIAYELHMQPETLSRILAKMVRNNLVSIDKNRVIVLDKNRLCQIYE